MANGKRKPKSLLMRFMQFVGPPTETGCRLWKLPKGGRYGRISLGNRKYMGAHVAAAIAYHGPVPKGKQVLHKCDTPACVNPKHLFFGTQKENIQDCIIKGRRVAVGRSPKTLTAELVIAIRAANGKGKDIATTFGVSPSTVCSIKKRRVGYWEWLP